MPTCVPDLVRTIPRPGPGLTNLCSEARFTPACVPGLVPSTNCIAGGFLTWWCRLGNLATGSQVDLEIGFKGMRSCSDPRPRRLTRQVHR
jgi:hypothetical protein